MLEMIYEPQMKPAKMLDSGIYNNFEYKIVSYGTHPCCYVSIPKNHKYYNKDYENIDIECHGGLTYSQKQDDNKYWIGWDYAHCNDYMGYYQLDCLKESGLFHNINDKKWTTEELLYDVKNVIKQLQQESEVQN